MHKERNHFSEIISSLNDLVEDEKLDPEFKKFFDDMLTSFHEFITFKNNKLIDSVIKRTILNLRRKFPDHDMANEVILILQNDIEESKLTKLGHQFKSLSVSLSSIESEQLQLQIHETILLLS